MKTEVMFVKTGSDINSLTIKMTGESGMQTMSIGLSDDVSIQLIEIIKAEISKKDATNGKKTRTKRK